MNDLPVFSFTRDFDAPVSLVWKVWTEAEYLAKWYGPNLETVIHKFDLQPDGEWLNEMKFPNGSNFQKVIFKEIVPEQKLVWHHCSADENWNVTANPMMPNWPRILLTTVTFAEKEGKTSVTLSQVPVDATPGEIECFAQMKEGMKGGWGAGYSLIDELLEEMKIGQ
ncbi:SRPBCC domain-containing protein [Sneathiella sp. P13V-1]|uniref:SRPBCC family protein n=1 Tax=Sneathiella sp. P13V-1 TaxID=2697366 RepID=UPI00187B233D|nr:SRPBCC domain-containing protein [Sneathiella sp. P13V-1]MBE7637661.1 SRPBCC domain-containing protein [Sneathiella sp. P13V-1]